MNKYFMTPNEYEKLLANENNNISSFNEGSMNEYFKQATDFEDISSSEVKSKKIDSKDLSKESVEEYLSSVVTGKKYSFRSEVGIVVADCNRFVTLEDLIDMVNSGKYNIVSASYVNNEMVQVHFQEIAEDYDDDYKKNI